MNNNSAIINSGSSSFYASFSDIQEINEFDNIQYKSLNNSEKNTKAEMLRSRNLKAYIKQLKYAKTLCERRMNLLNGSVNDEDYETTIDNRIKRLKNPLPIDAIVNNAKGQKLFLKFLEFFVQFLDAKLQKCGQHDQFPIDDRPAGQTILIILNLPSTSIYLSEHFYHSCQDL